MSGLLRGPRDGRLVAAAAILALVGVLVLPSGSGAAAPSPERARTCNDVVVQFEPEGSGGGTEVRAKRIKCRKARKVIKACIKGELREGWSGTYVDPYFKLRKGDKRIRYLPVGGGGCIPVG